MKPASENVFLLILIGITLFLGGCISHKNLLVLNETVPVRAADSVTYDPMTSRPFEFSLLSYAVQPNDNLFIRLNNYTDNSSDFFNSDVSNSGARFSMDRAVMYMTSYTIDDSGNVLLPLVGSFHVAGKTTREIKQMLDDALRPFLKFPFTTVRLSNFKITILGEVNDPGVHYMYDDKITLFQALGQAGDMTAFANRQTIKLVRDSETGTEIVYFNLRNAAPLSSKYFYLRPNDVIYVAPLKARTIETNARTVGLVLSSLTLIVLAVNLIIQGNR